MRLVIDIPKAVYKACKEKMNSGKGGLWLESIIAKGIPYEERPKGKWIEHSTYKGVLICSHCHQGSNRFYDTFKFCPNCGADMRKEEQNADKT